MRARAWRLVWVALIVVLAAGCQVRTVVGIDVHDDGSGTVTVSVGLDQEAVDRVGDLSGALRVDDLKATGWTVTGPTKETDGFTYVRAAKPFANPAEANKVFGEIAGAGGPFRDFRIARSRSFARTETTFDGTVDFAHGLESFTDSQLAQALDGKPLGNDVAAIEKAIGTPLDQAFSFKVAVRLPGRIASNATGSAANGAEWAPKLSDKAPSTLHAEGKSWRVGTIALVAVAAVALVAALVVLLVRLAGRTPPPAVTAKSASG